MQRYECLCCSFSGSRDDFIIEECVDLEPYGDQRVPRTSYEFTCPECNSDDVEEEWRPPY